MASDPDTSTPPTASKEEEHPSPTVSKEKDHRFRVSQLNLQNTSIANRLGTSTGHLDVEKAVDELLDTRKSNKLLTKVVIGLVAYSILLTAAIFGVSIAAAEVAKDTTIDSSTGFVSAKGVDDEDNHSIMKTAEAVDKFHANSFHGLPKDKLASITSVAYAGGAVLFQVNGFGTTEEKTMLMVEGGALVYDDTGLVDVIGEYPNMIAEAFRSEGEGEGRELQMDEGTYQEAEANSRKWARCRATGNPLGKILECETDCDCINHYKRLSVRCYYNPNIRGAWYGQCKFR
jgi:hypothetical protein